MEQRPTTYLRLLAVVLSISLLSSLTSCDWVGQQGMIPQIGTQDSQSGNAQRNAKEEIARILAVVEENKGHSGQAASDNDMDLVDKDASLSPNRLITEFQQKKEEKVAVSGKAKKWKPEKFTDGDYAFMMKFGNEVAFLARMEETCQKTQKKLEEKIEKVPTKYKTPKGLTFILAHAMNSVLRINLERLLVEKRKKAWNNLVDICENNNHINSHILLGIFNDIIDLYKKDCKNLFGARLTIDQINERHTWIKEAVQNSKILKQDMKEKLKEKLGKKMRSGRDSFIRKTDTARTGRTGSI